MRSGSETASTPASAVTDPHLSMIRRVYPRTPNGCEECLLLGTEWVHLRPCLTCGHVGCCDSYPLRHARAHAHSDGHPIGLMEITLAIRSRSARRRIEDRALHRV